MLRNDRVRLYLQRHLRDLEESFGSFVVATELGKIASEWDNKHNHEACRYCKRTAFSDFEFCEMSIYSPSHAFHSCPPFQNCTCLEEKS